MLFYQKHYILTNTTLELLQLAKVNYSSSKKRPYSASKGCLGNAISKDQFVKFKDNLSPIASIYIRK